MLKILGRKNSSNVQKVLWCCAELSLPFDRVDMGREFGGNDQPDYLAMNPNGTIPTIIDDGLLLWESNTIIRYLAEIHGRGTLWLEDHRSRASAERWMDWQLSVMHPAFAPLFHKLVRDPPEQRDPAAIAAAQEGATTAFAILDGRLEGKKYLAEEVFSVADIALGVYAYRWFQFDIDRAPLPHLGRWYDRLAERPAYAEHVMVGLA